MIRQAIEKDAIQIAELIVKGWQTAYKGLIDETFLKNLSTEKISKNFKQSIISQNTENNIYVYEENGKILGIIRFGKPDDNTDNKHNSEIHVLYVEPDLKRKGIGTKLFKYAKKYFINQEKQKLIIWCLKGNELAIRFYEKMGGQIVSERKTTVNNIEVEEVGLEYRLPDGLVN